MLENEHIFIMSLNGLAPRLVLIQRLRKAPEMVKGKVKSAFGPSGPSGRGSIENEDPENEDPKT